jgi:hypothetical protein
MTIRQICRNAAYRINHKKEIERKKVIVEYVACAVFGLLWAVLTMLAYN